MNLSLVASGYRDAFKGGGRASSYGTCGLQDLSYSLGTPTSRHKSSQFPASREVLVPSRGP